MNIVRLQIRRWASQAATELVTAAPSTQKLPKIDFIDDSIELPDEYQPRSLLEPLEEDISHYNQVNATFNFAQYINKSEGLQNLVKLGVNLHKIEKNPYRAKILMNLDFERDMKERLVFLNDYIPPEEMGTFITKNPMIFQQDIDNLQVRINYLESKKFDNEMIKRIVTKNPYWLLFPTIKVDARLGYFQKEYKLTGKEVRQLACTQPRLITYSLDFVKKNTFSLQEEMGFSIDDIKQIILSKPRILMKSHLSLIQSFNYVHLKMKIPHRRIVEIPGVLLCKARRLKERDEFLKKIGRAQYDCTKPCYVSLYDLITGDDAVFCLNVAKCSLLDYNTYLKSL